MGYTIGKKMEKQIGKNGKYKEALLTIGNHIYL